MQPSRRPRRPGRPWQASGHHVPGVGQAVTACDQAPSGHACQAARGPPRAGAAAADTAAPGKAAARKYPAGPHAPGSRLDSMPGNRLSQGSHQAGDEHGHERHTRR
jgi:hypothetical protein